MNVDEKGRPCVDSCKTYSIPFLLLLLLLLSSSMAFFTRLVNMLNVVRAILNSNIFFHLHGSRSGMRVLVGVCVCVSVLCVCVCSLYQHANLREHREQRMKTNNRKFANGTPFFTFRAFPFCIFILDRDTRAVVGRILYLPPNRSTFPHTHTHTLIRKSNAHVCVCDSHFIWKCIRIFGLCRVLVQVFFYSRRCCCFMRNNSVSILSRDHLWCSCENL